MFSTGLETVQKVRNEKETENHRKRRCRNSCISFGGKSKRIPFELSVLMFSETRKRVLTGSEIMYMFTQKQNTVMVVVGFPGSLAVL